MKKPMTREDLMVILEKLPACTPIYVRHGPTMDDAYPAEVRVFEQDDGGRKAVTVAYLDIDRTKLDWHRNFPEKYPHNKDVTDRFFGQDDRLPKNSHQRGRS